MNISDLHNYQNRAVRFILDNPSCALWMSMGLGKTAVCLTAIHELMRDQFTIDQTLIIAPLRPCQHTWPVEIKKWDHTRHLSHAFIGGSKQNRLNNVEGSEDIHIINRENVTWLVNYWIEKKRWPYSMIVIDEASSFKSPSSKRFKALKKVIGKTKKVIELTGTPASNSYLDIWSQIYLLDKGKRLGRTFTNYKSNYFSSDYMGYTWEILPGAEKQIQDKIGDLILSMKAEDYIELPDQIKNTISVDIPPIARKQYKEMEKHLLLELENETVEALNAAVLTNKLLQITNGAIYLPDKPDAWEEIHTQKIDALEEIINEHPGQPVLVAYNFKSDLARIKNKFPHAIDIKEDGAIERWNKKEINLLLAHPASAGHGLNLQTGGNIIVWFGLNWSLELYDQFNARLHRQGQTEPVMIHHILAKDTIDETVFEVLQKKSLNQKTLLNAIKNRGNN